jgi:hypothetical protein
LPPALSSEEISPRAESGPDELVDIGIEVPPIPKPGLVSYCVIKDSDKIRKKYGSSWRICQDFSTLFIGIKCPEGIAISQMQDDLRLLGIMKPVRHTCGWILVNPRLRQPRDFRPPELMGLVALRLDSEKKGKCFRMAIPDDTVYYPTSPDRSLYEIAKTGQKIDGVSIFTAMPPSRQSCVDHFSGTYLESEYDAFTIEDDKGQLVWMGYKASDKTFNVRAKLPWTDLLTFALCIGMFATKTKA